jgi:hypothetical protein
MTQGGYGKGGAGAPLARETTMTLRWFADRLQMGSWTYVSNLLRDKA